MKFGFPFSFQVKLASLLKGSSYHGRHSSTEFLVNVCLICIGGRLSTLSIACIHGLKIPFKSRNLS